LEGGFRLVRLGFLQKNFSQREVSKPRTPGNGGAARLFGWPIRFISSQFKTSSKLQKRAGVAGILRNRALGGLDRGQQGVVRAFLFKQREELGIGRKCDATLRYHLCHASVPVAKIEQYENLAAADRGRLPWRCIGREGKKEKTSDYIFPGQIPP
jgi:hypothetical protein